MKKKKRSSQNIMKAHELPTEAQNILRAKYTNRTLYLECYNMFIA